MIANAILPSTDADANSQTSREVCEQPASNEAFFAPPPRQIRDWWQAVRQRGRDACASHVAYVPPAGDEARRAPSAAAFRPAKQVVFVMHAPRSAGVAQRHQCRRGRGHCSEERPQAATQTSVKGRRSAAGEEECRRKSAAVVMPADTVRGEGVTRQPLLVREGDAAPAAQRPGSAVISRQQAEAERALRA